MIAAPVAPLSVNLGYALEPLSSNDSLNFRRLRVWLRAQPTGQHYDPEEISFRAIASTGSVENCVIRFSPAEFHQQVVAIGTISLNDRKDKRVDVFTFGGSLSGQSTLETTTCLFESPAPLLPLGNDHLLTDRLACEIEATLAQCRARWDYLHNGQGFDEQLCKLTPTQLYGSCLVNVYNRLETIHQRDNGLQVFFHYINHTRAVLQSTGQGSPDTPPIERLLELA